jgi:hypothetical protein
VNLIACRLGELSMVGLLPPFTPCSASGGCRVTLPHDNRHRPLPDEAVLPLPPHVSGMGRAERAVVTGPFLKYTASGLELRE